jgi:acyl-CoA thioesterase
MFAALGARPGNSRQFIQMPKVDSPKNCPKKDDPLIQTDGNLICEFDRRTALEDPDAGLEYMWIKPIRDIPITSGLLALTSDFMLGAHRNTRGGTSLDNTLRIFSVEPTDWILCVTQMSGFREGVAMGVTHQFTEEGCLLSTSSQTGLLPRR